MRYPAKPNRPGGLFSSVIVTLPWLGTWRPCYSCPKTPVKDNNVRTCEIISNCFERLSFNTYPKRLLQDNTILLSSFNYILPCGNLITRGETWLVGDSKTVLSQWHASFSHTLEVGISLSALIFCVKSQKRKEEKKKNTFSEQLSFPLALSLKTW